MRDKNAILFFFVTVVLIILIGIFRPREIDWTPTFSAVDKIPYGGYILAKGLPELFSDKKVSISKKPPFEITLPGRKTSYFFVQSIFDPSEDNVAALLGLADNGNDVFISSSFISGALVDSLKLKQRVILYPERVIKVFDKDTAACINSNFSNPILHTDSGYWHLKSAIHYYYQVYDTGFLNQGFLFNTPAKEATVLGTSGNGYPNFICIAYGGGRILLHNNPFAFTNYYMLKPENAAYAAKCFSYLQGNEIVWNEYFNQSKDGSSEASFRFILSKEPLRWAYYILLGSLLFYIIFNIKRRQRIIPVSEPYRNTSLEFTHLVGMLYYNQADHKSIMVKKISYLLEFIRNRHHLDTNEINDEFISKLAAKTGIENERIVYLFSLVQGVQKKNWLSQQELTDLTSAIQYFKTHSQ